jgi:transposase
LLPCRACRRIGVSPPVDLRVLKDLVVAKRFRPVDREQAFLLPPDMRDWLGADHLVWFVLDTVAALDLARFRARYQLGGVGRAAYDPLMMLGLLIYAYAVGQRSSRQIERLCQVDVAFRVACAQDVPDHATIARFRADHQDAITELFEQVLLLCARAGMGRLGTVALDGTKIAANAALSANRTESTLRQLAAGILAEAAASDAAEDEQFGEARGDELPAQLADPNGRAARITRMLDDIERERSARAAASQDVERAGQRVERAWERLARTRRRIHEQAGQRIAREKAAADAGGAIPGTRPVPVEQHYQVRQAKAALARAEHRQGALANPRAPAAVGVGEVKRNLTDPDSRIMKTRLGWIQGYNGQIVVSADYLILAAELTNDPTDVGHYQPLITTTCHSVADINTATSADWTIGTVLADAGYASDANLSAEGPERLIALGTRRDLNKAAATKPTTGEAPATANARERMDHRLRTPEGAALYKRRAATVEPVNGHLKDRRALRRFSRRGLSAANSEFRLAAAVTNLLRLRTHQAATH